MSIHLLSLIMLFATITACDAVDTVKEGVAHSHAVSDNLEKTFGRKNFVQFQWNDGSLISVNVTFKGIPPNGMLSNIVEKSSQAIAAEFKQKPKQIVIGFSIEP